MTEMNLTPSETGDATPIPAGQAELGLPWRLDIQHGIARFLRVDGRPVLGAAVDLDSDEGLALLATPDLRLALLRHIVHGANGLHQDALAALGSLSHAGGLSSCAGDPAELTRAREEALAVLQAYQRAGTAVTAKERERFEDWFEATYHEAAAPVPPSDLQAGRHKTTAFAWALSGFRHGLGAD